MLLQQDRRSALDRILFLTLLICLLGVGVFSIGKTVATNYTVKADELSEIEAEKAKKQAELDEIYKNIAKTANSKASIEEKLNILLKDKKRLKQVLNDLNEDIANWEAIYEVQADLLEGKQALLDEQRIKLYIESQKTLTQRLLGSQSLSGFINHYIWLRFSYSQLVEEKNRLVNEILVLREEQASLTQAKGDVKLNIKEAEKQIDKLEEERNRLQAQQANQYAQSSNLTDEIANLSSKAQEIIRKKTEGNSPPPSGGGGGGGGGGTVPPQPGQGDYDVKVDGKLIASKVEGPVKLKLENGGYFTTGSYKYRGNLWFRKDSNVYVINKLPLDDYMKGLGEMPSSWKSAALKSQAVAGRSYAVANLSKRSVYHYDLRDDTYDQNYVGVNKELENYGSKWVAAVEDTAGKVLKKDGSVINAFYHSTCGGHTLSSQEVWGGYRSYALAKSDWYSSGGNMISYDKDSPWSYKKWQNTNNTKAITEDLLNAAIYLDKHNASAQAQDNIISWSANKLKNTLGDDAIDQKIGSLSNLQHIYNSGGSSIKSNTRKTTSVTATGGSGNYSVDGGMFKLAYNLRAPGTNVIWSTLYDVKKSSSNYNFYSRGYPHRVGYCQYGAYGRAKAGQSYSQILSHYYNGASLKSYSMGRDIKIGLTKVGAATTKVKANKTITIYDGDNNQLGTAEAGVQVKVSR